MANNFAVWDELVQTDPKVLKGLKAKKDLSPLQLNKWTPFVRAYIVDPPAFKNKNWKQLFKSYDSVEGISEKEIIYGVKIGEDKNTDHWLLPLADSFTQFNSKRSQGSGANVGARRGGIGIKKFQMTYNAQDMVIFDILMDVEFNHETDIKSFKGKSLFDLGQDLIIQFGWSVPEGAMPKDDSSSDLADMLSAMWGGLSDAWNDIIGGDTGNPDLEAEKFQPDIDLTDRGASTSMWVRATHYSFDLNFQPDGALLGTYKLMAGESLNLQQVSGITKGEFTKAMDQLGAPAENLDNMGITPRDLVTPATYAAWPKDEKGYIPTFDIGPANSPWGKVYGSEGSEVQIEVLREIKKQVGEKLKATQPDASEDDVKAFVDSMSNTNNYYQLGDIIEAVYRAYVVGNKGVLPKGVLDLNGNPYPHSNTFYADIGSRTSGYFAVSAPWIAVGTAAENKAFGAFRENTVALFASLYQSGKVKSKPMNVNNVYELPISKDKVDAYIENKAQNKTLQEIYDDILTTLVPRSFELQFKPSLNNDRRILYWPADKNNISQQTDILAKTPTENEDKLVVFDWGTRHSLVESLNFEMAITPDVLYNLNLPYIQGTGVITAIKNMNVKGINPQSGNLSKQGAIAVAIQKAVNDYELPPGASFIPNSYITSHAALSGVTDWSSQAVLAIFQDDKGMPIIDPFVNFRHWYSGVKLSVHGFVGLEGLTTFQINAPLHGLDKCIYASTMIKHVITPEHFTTFIEGYQTEGVDPGSVSNEITAAFDSEALRKQKEDEAAGFAKIIKAQEDAGLVSADPDYTGNVQGDKANPNEDINIVQTTRKLIEGDDDGIEGTGGVIGVPSETLGGIRTEPENTSETVETDEVTDQTVKLVKKLLKGKAKLEKLERKGEEQKEKVKEQAKEAGIKVVKDTVAFTAQKLAGINTNTAEAKVEDIKEKKEKAEKIAKKAEEVIEAGVAVVEVAEKGVSLKDILFKIFDKLKTKIEEAAQTLNEALFAEAQIEDGIFEYDPNIDGATAKNYLEFTDALGEGKDPSKDPDQPFPGGKEGEKIKEIAKAIAEKKIPYQDDLKEGETVVSEANFIAAGSGQNISSAPKEKVNREITESQAKLELEQTQEQLNKVNDDIEEATTGINKKTNKEFTPELQKWLTFSQIGVPSTMADTHDIITEKITTLKEIIIQWNVPCWQILEYNSNITITEGPTGVGFTGEFDDEAFVNLQIPVGQKIRLPLLPDAFFDKAGAASETWQKYMFALTRPSEPTAEAPPIAVWYQYEVKEGDTLNKIIDMINSKGYSSIWDGEAPLDVLVEQNTKYDPGLSVQEQKENDDRRKRWQDTQYNLHIGEKLWVPFPSRLDAPAPKNLSDEEKEAKETADKYKFLLRDVAALINNLNEVTPSSGIIDVSLFDKRRTEMLYGKTQTNNYRYEMDKILKEAVEFKFLTQEEYDQKINVFKQNLSDKPDWGVPGWESYRG